MLFTNIILYKSESSSLFFSLKPEFLAFFNYGESKSLLQFEKGES